MGKVAKFLRLGFYPLARAADQLRESGQSLKGVYATARTRMQGELKRAAAKDPAAAFEALVVANEWTAEGLAEQLKAVHRTKWTAICTALLSTAAVVAVLVVASSEGVFYLLLGPIAVFAICLGLVQTLKYALFEEQLRTRRLSTLGDFMSDPDMWKKVLS